MHKKSAKLHFRLQKPLFLWHNIAAVHFYSAKTSTHWASSLYRHWAIGTPCVRLWAFVAEQDEFPSVQVNRRSRTSEAHHQWISSREKRLHRSSDKSSAKWTVSDPWRTDVAADEMATGQENGANLFVHAHSAQASFPKTSIFFHQLLLLCI